MPDQSKFLVVDDHDLFRRGLIFELSDAFPGCQILEARDFDEALDHLAKDELITLASFDLGMPGMQGGASLRSVREAHPDLRVVILSGREDRRDVLAALECGVHGYLPKSLPAERMVDALRMVLAGGIYAPPLLANIATYVNTVQSPIRSVEEPAKPPPGGGDPSLEDLTARQRAVLERLIAGRSSKEIGRDLTLAEGTVKIHLAAIYRAFGVRNRTEAVAIAISLGLAASGPPR